MLFWNLVNSPSGPTTSLFSGLLPSPSLQYIAFPKGTVWMVLGFLDLYGLVLETFPVSTTCWLRGAGF